MIAAPTIETERLVLRGPEPRDAPVFMSFMTSERARFVGGPLEPGRAWRAFASFFGHWVIRGHGLWIATARDGDGTALAGVGGWEPEGWPEAEMSWSVWAPEAEGRGIAEEAARAALGCLRDRFGWRTAVSYVDPDNARSRRLAERLGASLDPEAPSPASFDGPMLVYRHRLEVERAG